MGANLYRYWEAPAARPGAPLVFAFHGTGGDETQFAPLARKLWPEAAIVSPRGDVVEHGALRFFRRKAEGVYDFEDLAVRRRAMADFVRAHKERLAPGLTVGIGYSNGANILAAMAFEEADLFDRLVLMHPLIPWTPGDNPGLARARVLITAGRRDPICPPPLTIALRDYFARQGAPVELEWHDGGHELHPSEIDAISRWLRKAA
jgi:phospholipase/carboxylesterase